MALNLIGNKYGKLTVIEKLGKKRRCFLWLCKCECGNVTETIGSLLKLGRKKSCGCLLTREGRWNWSGHNDISGFFWRRIIEGAKSRKLTFNITIQDAWTLFEKQNKKCNLSGDDLYFSKTNGRYDGNASLDRIDSSKGYELDNIQWIHKSINMMKMDMPDNDLIYWCRKISEFTKNIKINIPSNDIIKKRNIKGYYFPKEKVLRSNREKTYTLMNPNGEIITIENMLKFCRRYNYEKGKMYSLANGKIKEYRGWKSV